MADPTGYEKNGKEDMTSLIVDCEIP
jgi:hypothetical protein